MRTLEEHRDAILAAVTAAEPVRLPLAGCLGLVLCDGRDLARRPAGLRQLGDGRVCGAGGRARRRHGRDPGRAAGRRRGRGRWRRHPPRARPGQVAADHDRRPDARGRRRHRPGRAHRRRATEVALHLAPEAGRSVRHRGEDVRTGDLVLPAGHPIGPGTWRSRRRPTSPSSRCTHGRGWPSCPPATSWSPPGRCSSTGRSSTPTHVMLSAARRGGRRRGRRVGAPARRRRRGARRRRDRPARPTWSSRAAASRWASTTRSRRC